MGQIGQFGQISILVKLQILTKVENGKLTKDQSSQSQTSQTGNLTKKHEIGKEALISTPTLTKLEKGQYPTLSENKIGKLSRLTKTECAQIPTLVKRTQSHVGWKYSKRNIINSN